MIVSLTDRFMLCVACSAAVLSVVVGHGNVDAADIFVANHSFEAVDTLPVSGIWPEADIDPVNANFWLEPGPVDENINAFPPELIPPGFAPPAGATLDTGLTSFYHGVSLTPVSDGCDEQIVDLFQAPCGLADRGVIDERSSMAFHQVH